MSRPELHSDPFATTGDESTSGIHTSLPLFERDDRIGNLLRQGNVEFQDQVDQHRALARLDAALGRTQAAPVRSSFWSFASPAWAGVPLVALAIWFGVQAGTQRSDEPSALHSEVLSARGTQPVPQREEIARLAQGQNLLPDGSSVHTDGVSRATWRRTAGGIVVELESGAVQCAVTKQRAGAHFVVDAGGYSFVVVGTELSVHSGEHEARLSVHSGIVEVRKGEQTLARVGAGETWRGPVEKASADKGESHGGGTAPAAEAKRERAKPPAAPENPSKAAGQDCSALLKNQAFGEAEACFALKAQGTGLSAELGLFELARVRSSALGNTAGAVQALEEHRRRFPTGVLSSQVQLALVRMLVSEKRDREALETLEPLIARGGAKLPELLRLRAELHRSRGECDKALPDYEALLAQPAYAEEARRGKEACLLR